MRMAVAEKRDLYEVLGIHRECSPDEIRSAYKKLALQRHPDKLVQSGLSQEDATAQFQELVHAYEVLSDPKERTWYDSHRSQILFSDAKSSGSNSPIIDLGSFFSNAVFFGYSDTGKGFYKVYADLFGKVYSAELNYARKMGLGIDSVSEAPVMGNLDSPYNQVTAFYNYWLGFATAMDFGWVDMYDAAAGESRRSRRMMEEENKKLRKKARREYNDMVRGLAEFVKKRDKRVIDMALKRKMEDDKKREEKKKKMEQEKLERARAYKVAKETEWAKADEELEEEDDIFGDDGDGEDKKEEELYCVVCGKKFKSEKQWHNHEKSKKHKEKVAALRETFIEDEAIDEETKEEVSEEDEVINNGVEESLKEDGIGEIEKRMRKNLEINGESKSGEEDEISEVGGDIDVEDEIKDEAGSSTVYGKDHGADAMNVEEREEVSSSGGNGEDDGISILEAMLSGHRNRRKAAASMQEDLKSSGGDTEFMEYSNRKDSRKNRRGKKERGKKSNGESGSTDVDERNGFINTNKDTSIARGEAKSAEDDEVIEKHKKERGNGKKDTNTKPKNLPKGKKGKASAKNSDNLCETCGEEFESRNKLHKHLGETGHAMLKFRR
ncbi:hypothetical protein SAY86_005992 [Trapa natans]|uniref:Uncharacterized protein n=1 Tax=Trapa natans TaxID=22666 RepID=A0AAN7L5R7_TRANT|nr:hypothetical protein SAY86_005992 [Trapa natans]